MIKDFLMRQMLKRQGATDAQIDQILPIINKNPELFQKIAKETQERVKKGENQTQAAIMVMKKYQAELKKLQQQ